jgi:uncharacterized Zn-binding protein involved in type VI secretion
MTSTKDGRKVIRLGDTTTHGGRVISVAQTLAIDMDRPIACVGDMVQCPRCRGIYPIVEGDNTDTIDGVPVAYHGHRTACGAALISSS